MQLPNPVLRPRSPAQPQACPDVLHQLPGDSARIATLLALVLLKAHLLMHRILLLVVAPTGLNRLLARNGPHNPRQRQTG